MPEYYCNLGDALRQNGDLEGAVAACRRPIEIVPDFAAAHHNLGTALVDQGRFLEAIAFFRRAAQLDPASGHFRRHLGDALYQQGQLDESVAVCREAIQLDPGSADAHYNLGNALQAKGRLDEAVRAYHCALEICPAHFETLNNLGNTLSSQGSVDAALAVFRSALQIETGVAEVLPGVMALARGSVSMSAYRAALCHNLGNCLKGMGQIDSALACYRKALALQPAAAVIHSSLVFTLSLHPDNDPASHLAEAREWDRRHAQPLKNQISPHRNEPTPERRLRIGYLSPDFRHHVVSRNFLPLLKEHDHGRFEIFGYGSVANPDAVTDEVRSFCDVWRDIASLADADAAQMIRTDGIDILVDLALHTAGNRLPLFGRKPAPIQVAYLGYNGTTGLEAIDYRLSDPYLDPPEIDLSCYSEQTVRLPHCTWCYEPDGPMPEVSPLPALTAGFVTFICRNSFPKASAATLSLWAEVLEAVPGSRLVLAAPEGSCREAASRHFARAGIARERLEFVGPREPWHDFVNSYHRADVALDPFPYSGWITTCDALWMGVPVVTLSGRTAVGRGGRSILSSIGLPELVAESPQEYLEIAVALARDLPRLSELRLGLRERMGHSPLRDAAGLARGIEAAFRQLWRQWCLERKTA